MEELPKEAVLHFMEGSKLRYEHAEFFLCQIDDEFNRAKAKAAESDRIFYAKIEELERTATQESSRGIKILNFVGFILGSRRRK